MTLGEILNKAAREDISSETTKHMAYIELVRDGRFWIKLSSELDRDAYIECSVPDNGTEEEKNYCRMYFLSMAFNAAIYGMRKHKKNKNDQKGNFRKGSS